ncbi:hypothetical protein EV702DRAFT_1051859 [Suillus placidus]|uniref:Uncharacterized protein n=1 Tax=Suillus placidus TaxID=48579 RepID=A0A9P7CWC8_9AGAM|nr:hypothetical protein EV702DRAFT_1051859 [Suillus placidus]
MYTWDGMLARSASIAEEVEHPPEVRGGTLAGLVDSTQTISSRIFRSSKDHDVVVGKLGAWFPNIWTTVRVLTFRKPDQALLTNGIADPLTAMLTNEIDDTHYQLDVDVRMSVFPRTQALLTSDLAHPLTAKDIAHLLQGCSRVLLNRNIADLLSGCECAVRDDGGLVSVLILRRARTLLTEEIAYTLTVGYECFHLLSISIRTDWSNSWSVQGGLVSTLILCRARALLTEETANPLIASIAHVYIALVLWLIDIGANCSAQLW